MTSSGAVSAESWSDRARRRGRAVGFRQLLGGSLLALVVFAALVGGAAPPSLRPLLVFSFCPLYSQVVSGWRRLRIEASPPAARPLDLPAATEPGAFGRLAEPRPAFGLRIALRPMRAVVLIGVVFGVPTVVVAATRGPVAALPTVILFVVVEALCVNTVFRGIPEEVRIADGALEWRARRRRLVLPLGSLRRVRPNTLPSGAVVLEFDGGRSRLVSVTGGFADFLDALSVACPQVEVSSAVVEQFGSWSGKLDGFYVETPGATG